jgi:predicted tellurium resistance membrane protein TerC
MGLVDNENKVVIGFKGVLVIALIIIGVLSIPAFANNYPHLGWLCISTVVFVAFGWIYLANEPHHKVALVIALIFLAVGIIAYVGGVPQEWRWLTKQEQRPQKTTAIISNLPTSNSFTFPFGKL